jgi:HPt (histidine-containing phosphotransfer) domain-containing protein
MNDVAAAIADLRAKFLARSTDDLQALRRWSAAGAPPDDAHRRILHRLAGAAGTFGFHDLSDFAKRAEDALHDGASPAGPALRQLVDELDQVTSNGAEEAGRPVS